MTRARHPGKIVFRGLSAPFLDCHSANVHCKTHLHRREDQWRGLLLLLPVASVAHVEHALALVLLALNIEYCPDGFRALNSGLLNDQ